MLGEIVFVLAFFACWNGGDEGCAD